jgi:desulfoferrodoxin-like iron-binding protein
MTKRSNVYKCAECRTIIAVLQESEVEGKGKLSCCSHEMINVTPDEAKRITYGLGNPGAP